MLKAVENKFKDEGHICQCLYIVFYTTEIPLMVRCGSSSSHYQLCALFSLLAIQMSYLLIPLPCLIFIPINIRILENRYQLFPARWDLYLNKKCNCEFGRNIIADMCLTVDPSKL